MSFIQTSRNSPLHSLKRTEVCTRLYFLKVFKLAPAFQAKFALLLFWVQINEFKREHSASITSSCQYIISRAPRSKQNSCAVQISYVDPERM